jgi:hypothetical protein
MAITSLDGIIAGAKPARFIHKVGPTMEAAGVMHSLFYAPGVPGAAAAPAPGLGGAALAAYAGQIPFSNPASGNTYLNRFSAVPQQTCSVLLLDRLWHNSGITITQTTGQTINSAAWPARCPPLTGATPNADGNDILVGVEVSAATGNASAITNTTLTYTNEAGTGSRTGTIASFPATAVAGTFVPFALQAGDKGVRSVQSLTLGTSYVSGTIHLVAYRVLAMLDCIANHGNALDAITGGFPQLYDDSVPFIAVIPTGTTAMNLQAMMAVAQG